MYIGSMMGMSPASNSTNLTAGSFGRISGLASGIDTESIVNSLMMAEQIPLDRIKQQEQMLQWQQQDYQSVKDALTSLQNSVHDLKLQATFQANTATTSNDKVVTATPGLQTVQGAYYVSVEQMATQGMAASSQALSIDPAQTLSSQGITSTSISIGSSTITIDPTKQSLNDVLSQINQSGQASAFYDQGSKRVFFMSTSTGGQSQVSVLDNGNFFSSLGFNVQTGQQTTIAQGKDAMYSIDGVQMTNSTNTVTFNGMTLNLTGLSQKDSSGSDQPTIINVSRDVDGIVKKIEDFVDAYNKALTTTNSFINARKNLGYSPLTDAQKSQMTQDQIDKWQNLARSGDLSNDPLLMDTVSSIRNSGNNIKTGQPIDNIGGQTVQYDSLASIGITTGDWQEYGQLHVDEDQLRTALQTDPNSIMSLFTNDPSLQGVTDPAGTGIAVKMYDAVAGAIDNLEQMAGSPTDTVDSSMIGLQLGSLKNQETSTQSYLDSKRAFYEQEFAQMEQAMAQMNSQSAYFSSLLAG